MSDNKQNDKPKEKLFTKDEVNKEITKAVEHAREAPLRYTLKRGHGHQMNAYPAFDLAVCGGTQELIDELASAILELVSVLEVKYRTENRKITEDVKLIP